MSDATLRFYFDLVDPLSYLFSLELAECAVPVRYVPFERRPAPAALTDTMAPEWRERWHEAMQIAGDLGVTLTRPRIVPWSGKALELLLHAEERGMADETRPALFSAYHVEGRDIGRVDVLVGIATGLGLDLTETKAVLDVDRFQPAILEARGRARREGVADACVLTHGTSRLEGFHNRSEIRTFVAAR